MVLDPLKWLKETSFTEKRIKKKNMNFCTKRKSERFYERKSLFISGVKEN